MRRTRSGCCARAASGHAAVLPSPAMNSRRRIVHSSEPLYGRPTAAEALWERASTEDYCDCVAPKSVAIGGKPDSPLVPTVAVTCRSTLSTANGSTRYPKPAELSAVAYGRAPEYPSINGRSSLTVSETCSARLAGSRRLLPNGLHQSCERWWWLAHGQKKWRNATIPRS
jgi:hypothetical protein